MAEHRVLAVEVRRRPVADVELTARRVRVLAARHRHRPPQVLVLVELRLDGVAGPARAVPLGAATLYHEVGDDPVEVEPVVEALLRERDEVLDRLRRIFRVELQPDLAALLQRDDSRLLHRDSFLIRRRGAGATDLRRVNPSLDFDRLHAVADLDRVDDLHAADHPTERGVLTVQMAGRTEHDVELAARRIGLALPRHPEQAAVELAIVKLGLDRVPGTAGSHRPMVHRERLRLRVAELDDEPRLDAVEALAVVEARPDQLDEVLDVLGRVDREEFQGDLAALLERDHRRRRFDDRLVLGQRRRGDKHRHDEGEQTIQCGRPPAINESNIIHAVRSGPSRRRDRMERCSSARTSVTLRSSPTSTTARPRSWTRCSGSPGSFARTSRCPSASWTPSTSSARRASRSWPRTRPSRTAAFTSISWTPRATPTSARRSSGR